MNSLPDVSGWQAAVLSFLSALALLAVRTAATILKRNAGLASAPFQGATIDFGLWRIRVSRRRASGSNRKPRLKRSVEAASGSTAEPSLTDARSLDPSRGPGSSVSSSTDATASTSFGNALEVPF